VTPLTPSLKFRQNAAVSLAPGNRPAIPITAIDSSSICMGVILSAKVLKFEQGERKEKRL
jgi:hypothetical protein